MLFRGDFSSVKKKDLRETHPKKARNKTSKRSQLLDCTILLILFADDFISFAFVAVFHSIVMRSGNELVNLYFLYFEYASNIFPIYLTV